MNRVVRSAQAVRDLDTIWNYIASDDRGAADRLIVRIDEAFSFLARTPRAGRSRPAFGTDWRSFVVGRYVIFYRPTPEGIRVLRVIAGVRDLARELRR